MDITLYKFSKRRNSTARPTGGTVCSGSLRGESGMLSPSITLQLGNASAPDYNYAYIPAFGRYYWITEITAIGGVLWRANMSVDVLATYKPQIAESSKYVVRSSAVSNGAIIDTLYPVKVDPLEPVAVGVPLLTGGAPWTGTFMIGVITPYGTSGGVTIYALNASQFLSLKQALMTNDSFWSNITDLDLKNLAICISDPLQYIAWCRYYPFSLPANSTTDTPLSIGKVNVGNMPMLNANMTLWDLALNPIQIAKHPQSPARGAWLNSEPYSSYYLYWEPVGMVQLPSERLHGISNVYINVKIDFLSGMGRLTLYRSTVEPLNFIYSTSFMIGCDVPLSQVMSSNPVGLISTAVGAIGAAGSAMAGNVPGSIAGGLSAVGSFIDAVSPNVRTLNSSRGTLLTSGEYLTIISVFNRIADDNNAEFGRPLCEVRTLSSIPGFIQCRDGEISAPATESELRELEQFLTGGFYYE